MFYNCLKFFRERIADQFELCSHDTHEIIFFLRNETHEIIILTGSHTTWNRG